MAYLSYKTRKHASPQGKPRVYLCLHPDDHALIDAIADEILSEVNCAVFYHTDPITDVEEHLRDLAEMNLFVIPVTTRFLTKPSDALTLDVPFAKDNHIPILPLMQESGLDALFNNVLGELQYLDPRQSDQTAIPYKEKLSQYLSAVLVGDALAEAVRNAFDAYIFLSYRKKDRAYAQELMRLIHENDFCRDVAIWYDEYLIPGENFNDMIASALEKSELFALAVTPNLVNEKNYIMTTEYPMAQKHKKPIVPIEMARTNSLSLKMKYPKLPRVRDCHDPSAVAKALAEALSTIVLRVGDTDPRHNFFIGLAYLSGIDVEKNHDRALSLITFAAEAGLPEAVKKLVTMYQNGEGVARSYETAIVWQKKLVKLYQTAYEDQPSESTA
ncbi:MAG: toll/interleukin-1 receptor domain-containing protein, partial [Clostridia bacterium]|nr:toll/interleukin-1 receptor domain-containing protein [Clostridia bacterium]